MRRTLARLLLGLAHAIDPQSTRIQQHIHVTIDGRTMNRELVTATVRHAARTHSRTT